MEASALARARAERLQAPNAHLPSLPAWQDEDHPSAATAAPPVLGRPLSGGAEGDAGQPRQADRRGRWSQEPPPGPAARPRGPPAEPTHRPRGTAGLEPQTGDAGPPSAQHPNPARPPRPDPGSPRAGIGMGGALPAARLRLPAG